MEIGGPLTSSIFRYQAGDPESKELLTLIPTGGRNSMTMSLDQSKIYINTIPAVFEIDVVDGTVGVLFEIPYNLFGRPGGIAVVPPPPPIPTMTEWGMILMTLLTLTVGTIGIQRHRSVFG